MNVARKGGNTNTEWQVVDLASMASGFGSTRAKVGMRVNFKSPKFNFGSVPENTERLFASIREVPSFEILGMEDLSEPCKSCGRRRVDIPHSMQFGLNQRVVEESEDSEEEDATIEELNAKLEDLQAEYDKACENNQEFLRANQGFAEAEKELLAEIEQLKQMLELRLNWKSTSAMAVNMKPLLEWVSAFAGVFYTTQINPEWLYSVVGADQIEKAVAVVDGLQENLENIEDVDSYVVVKFIADAIALSAAILMLPRVLAFTLAFMFGAGAQANIFVSHMLEYKKSLSMLVVLAAVALGVYQQGGLDYVERNFAW